MEELRGGHNDAPAIRDIRDKINEIVRWIDGQEEMQRKTIRKVLLDNVTGPGEQEDLGDKEKSRDLKKDRMEEILKNVGECLRAYRDRECDFKGYPFRRDFHGFDGSVEVAIGPHGDDPRDFDVTVNVRG